MALTSIPYLEQRLNSVSSGGKSSDSVRGGSAANAKLTRVRVATAIGWTLVILMLCWLPRTIVHEVEEGSGWFKIPYLDKIIHGAIFVVFSVLWTRVSVSRSRFAWVGMWGLVLAIVSELGQTMAFVNRDASIDDAATDFAGAMVGLLMASRVEPWLRRAELRVWPEPPTKAMAAASSTESDDAQRSPG